MQVTENEHINEIIYLSPESKEDECFLEAPHSKLIYHGRSYQVIDGKIGVHAKINASYTTPLGVIELFGCCISTFLATSSAASALPFSVSRIVSCWISRSLPIPFILFNISNEEKKNYTDLAEDYRSFTFRQTPEHQLSTLQRKAGFTELGVAHFFHPKELSGILEKVLSESSFIQTFELIKPKFLQKFTSNEDFITLFRKEYGPQGNFNLQKCMELYHFFQKKPEYFNLLSQEINANTTLFDQLSMIEHTQTLLNRNDKENDNFCLKAIFPKELIIEEAKLP